MKKIPTILAIIIVLIAAWLGTAWYTGTRIQAQVSNVIARMNANLVKNQPAIGAQIKQISYERGLLWSHARFALVSNLPGKEPLSETEVTFSHGPFPLAALQRGDFLPQRYQAHIEVLAKSGPFKMLVGALMNGKPPLVVDIGCSYGNHCSGTGSVPPIDADLRPFSKKAKLTFGGIQMRFDFSHQSDTDYKTNVDGQLLPLSIGGQNFGSGQITVTGNALSATEVIAWKTDQGASKISVALSMTRPMPLGGDPVLAPDDLPKLFKTVSAKLELSKPMVIDLVAHTLNLAKGIDLAGARQQVGAQLDAMLSNSPEAAKFLQIQGDLLVSDWQYVDGKLSINGQDNPEVLERIKQGYLTQRGARAQALSGNGAASNGSAAQAAPSASAPEQVASSQ